MNKIQQNLATNALETHEKFVHPDWTAKGEPRASVALTKLETLWFNTGTLCNIECVNCYIESSPKNDRLTYIKASEVAPYLDEIAAQNMGTTEIGFTGGEPFLNPDMLAMSEGALTRGFNVIILTNAMAPMQRPHIKKGLIALNKRFGKQLSLRVSLDHYSKKLHETERGLHTFNKALQGIDWLSQNGFTITIAGRTCWNETNQDALNGYAALFLEHNWSLDAANPHELILFPEMDEKVDVPEITTACWDILNVHPDDMMCATSRMIVKRKGDTSPSVLPCTLLPYDKPFNMGTTLQQAANADGNMFDKGEVKLCHTHCAKFCVLGGGSCSG